MLEHSGPANVSASSPAPRRIPNRESRFFFQASHGSPGWRAAFNGFPSFPSSSLGTYFWEAPASWRAKQSLAELRSQAGAWEPETVG